MNLKKTYLFIIIFFFLFFIVSEFISFYNDYKLTKKDLYKDDKIAINNLVHAQENNLRMLANIFSNDSTVIEGYEKDDPKIIINHLLPIWKKLKQEKLVYEIHFFKPPATSFVNFSNFHSIGKNLIKIRKDVVWVTSSFKPSTHNLVCKTYAGERATYPIMSQSGKMLGGLSLGKKIDWLPEAIKHNTNRDAFLIYEKKAIDSLEPTYYKKFMENKVVVGEYILANSTSKLITPKILKSIKFDKNIQYLELQDHLYLLNKYPIIDFTKHTMGYIFVLNPVRPLFIAYLKDFTINFILIFITAIIIFFITKKVMQELNKKLQLSLDELNLAQESAKMGSYLYNLQTGDIDWSQNHYKLFKVDKENFIPSIEKFMTFVHPDDKVAIKEQLQNAIKSKLHNSFEYRIVLRDHTELYVRSTAMLIKDDKGVEFLSGTIQDITDNKILEIENKRKTELLIKQLYTDELTQLPNRSALVRDMKQYSDANLAIVNIKSFKNINDVFGFNVGNYTLETLAKRLLLNCNEYELTLYRIGSDEFAILNRKLSHQLFEEFIANTIEQFEHEVFFYHPKDVEINIALYAGICFSKKNRMACADVALSEANKLHKDYVIYSSSENLIQEQEQKLEMINIIKNALQNDKILLYKQAIVNRDQEKNKYETLVRLEHDGRVLSPAEFLDIAQKTKYYPLITRKIVSRALEVFKDRKEEFSINLIAEDILNESTLAYIRKEILSFEDKDRIVFELVESEDLYQLQEVADFIKEMQSLGIKIAIDDFGTGYSNFSYMMMLQPDYIKIDGSLIKDIDRNEKAKNIVTTIITFANELGCKTIAEYVHSKEVFEVCRELGVDEFQGYYFSEPKAT
jgi:diguanylate cyclase (GGDEF)-like protein